MHVTHLHVAKAINTGSKPCIAYLFVALALLRLICKAQIYGDFTHCLILFRGRNWMDWSCFWENNATFGGRASSQNRGLWLHWSFCWCWYQALLSRTINRYKWFLLLSVWQLRVNCINMRLHVFMAMNICTMMCLFITMCDLVGGCQHLGGSYCLYLQVGSYHNFILMVSIL